MMITSGYGLLSTNDLIMRKLGSSAMLANVLFEKDKQDGLLHKNQKWKKLTREQKDNYQKKAEGMWKSREFPNWMWEGIMRW